MSRPKLRFGWQRSLPCERSDATLKKLPVLSGIDLAVVIFLEKFEANSTSSLRKATHSWLSFEHY
jgi:hypothetical protein